MNKRTMTTGIPMELNNDPMPCDKCGRNMKAKSGASIIGMEFTLRDNPMPTGDIQEIYPELELPFTWRICWVCTVEVLGWTK